MGQKLGQFLRVLGAGLSKQAFAVQQNEFAAEQAGQRAKDTQIETIELKQGLVTAGILGAAYDDASESGDTAKMKEIADDMGILTEKVSVGDERIGRAFKNSFIAGRTKPKKEDSAPKVKNFREGKFIVNKQWNPDTKAWDEISRGPVSQQQINLRNKPSERVAAKDFDRILDQANTAEDQLLTIDKARALLPNVESGKFGPLKQFAREWGDALGIPIDTDKMIDAASFRSTMKNAVLDGMKAIKGTASEADRKTVEDSIASMSSPEEVNAFLVDSMESLAKRNIERANFYDVYAKNNEGSLLGARTAWSKRMKGTPLIRKTNGRIYHYYKFREQAIAANKAAFADETEDEIRDAIDSMWTAK